MERFDQKILKQLYIPPADSHKGQNGKLLLIGGSHLFHAASLWALKIASKIVDMVFYASVPENSEIVQKAKQEFRDGIVISRDSIEDYIKEADAILIGPGMLRAESKDSRFMIRDSTMRLSEINQLQNEGEQTYYLTTYLLEKYPDKKWVVDAGALQMMKLSTLEKVGKNAILTPHPVEFQRLFNKEANEEGIRHMAKTYGCIIVVKGKRDIICSSTECVQIAGGNAGMTKGGTGDVLAGLIAALACNNDLFIAAQAGSFINKKAGDALFKKAGYYFNASDLVEEIPKVMKEVIGAS